MGRFLVVGIGPLPFEDTALPLGPGLRTWHFAKTLHGAGHSVRLVTLRPWEPVGGEAGPLRHAPGLEEFRLPFSGSVEPDPRLGALSEELRPDAIFGATVPGAVRAAHFASAIPFWADVFGDYLAESQLKAARVRDDSVVDHWRAEIAHVLERADVFSTVSARQAWALVGQLGFAGRLRSATVGYDFVRTIPCAIPDQDVRPLQRSENLRAGGATVRALWSGSFNTWCDVATFSAGAEAALLATPGLEIEITGGAVPGHDDETFEEFRSFIAQSRARNRFILHGWVASAVLDTIYARTDFGLSLGRWSYERALGSENRITALLARGIPVIVSRGSELAEEVAQAGAGLVIPAQDARAFYAALRTLATDRERREEMARAARAYAQRLTYSATAGPLLDWAAQPRFAPDRPRR
jgi:glycosyltransferase involved in cell wall biosynthesis